MKNAETFKDASASVTLTGAGAFSFCLIPLTRGYVAKVSPQDYDRVSAFKWSAIPQKHTTYAQRRTGPKRWTTLHRFIMNAQPGQLVDHRDGDGINCTRENMRFATYGQNTANSKRMANPKTPFKGVAAYRNHFRARIRFEGRNYFLGGYPTAEEAARAYDRKAVELFGPFARLNFPEATR